MATGSGVTAYWSNGPTSLLLADARNVPLETGSAHCIVTSPPYYGLRQYKDNDHRGIGLEASIEAYLDNLMEVMTECKRVLRSDGVMWVNLGDSYGGSGGGSPGSAIQANNRGANFSKGTLTKGTLTGGLPANGNHAQEPGTRDNHGGQLLGIPARFHLRMMAEGWTVRDQVIWWKQSPMPESMQGTRWEQHRVKVGGEWAKAFVDNEGYGKHGNTISDRRNSVQWADCPGCDECRDTDGLVLRNGSWRCTSAYEVIFQCTKIMGYYGDGEAVKVISDGKPSGNKARVENHQIGLSGFATGFPYEGQGTANRRDVWDDIKPDPNSDMTCPECGRTFKRRVYQRFPKFEGHPICPRCEEPLIAHYATFPVDVPRLCIQASTSEAGVCPACGAQLARVVKKKSNPKGINGGGHREAIRDGALGQRDSDLEHEREGFHVQTLGWRPTCKCPEAAHPVPAVVWDPFVGTGTTCVAAQRLGRRSYGSDISEDYLKQAIGRLEREPLALI